MRVWWGLHLLCCSDRCRSPVAGRTEGDGMEVNCRGSGYHDRGTLSASCFSAECMPVTWREDGLQNDHNSCWQNAEDGSMRHAGDEIVIDNRQDASRQSTVMRHRNLDNSVTARQLLFGSCPDAAERNHVRNTRATSERSLCSWRFRGVKPCEASLETCASHAVATIVR